MPQGNTILVVDDDPLHLTLYTWILQSHGYKCETALVKSTAVDLPKDAIDLVLLDYHLNSSLTSLDVIKQIKSTYPDIPVVILSNMQWMPDDVKNYAREFVNKGDPKRLVDTIKDILEDKAQ